MPLEPCLIDELKEAFDEHAVSGVLSQKNIGNVFLAAGEGVPSFRVREWMDNNNKGKDNDITFEEFIKLFEDLNLNKSWGAKLRTRVQAPSGVTQISGSNQSAVGTVHSVSDGERISFSNYVNRILKKDPELTSYLPINPNSDELYSKLTDGIVLCKLVNWAAPNTIDERAVNKTKLTTFKIRENLDLAINSCSAIGCHVVNIGPDGIIEMRVHLILGLLWQIIRIGLMANINLKSCPNLMCLLEEGEQPSALLSLSPEELLLRWVNYQLAKTNCPKKLTSFNTDLKDSVIYAHLMDTVMKDQSTHDVNAILGSKDLTKRAELVIENAENANCAGLLQPYDIVSGNGKLNLAFTAELFNMFPCLEPPQQELVIEETREEKTYRNWMNSRGVKPTVTYLYNDLTDGHVLLQLMDILQAGIVNWDKVNKAPFKGASANIKKIENCNKAVEIGKQLKLSLIGIAGDDIYNCNKILVLGLVWQMMHLYTMKMLQELSGGSTPITDAEILAWTNQKLAPTGIKIGSFKDPALSNAKPILELVEIMKPNTLNRDYISNGSSEEEKLKNSQYAVSLCRKIGAPVYALPEDIVEGKFKMIMTIFACLMALDLKK